MDQRYFVELAAAFVRGRLGERAFDDAADVQRGLIAGLKLHKFKRNTELPRVRRVIDGLRGLHPERLLDGGSGRGTFLWPLLDALPALPVMAIDRDQRRAHDLGGGTRRRGAPSRGAHGRGPSGVGRRRLRRRLAARGAGASAQAGRGRAAGAAGGAPLRGGVGPHARRRHPRAIHLFDEKSLAQLSPGARRMQFEGSRLQPGDEDLGQVPFAEIAGRHLVVEEKLDGANCALSAGEQRRVQIVLVEQQRAVPVAGEAVRLGRVEKQRRLGLRENACSYSLAAAL